MEKIINALSEEFKISPQQVTDTVALIDDGNTIPFIARYRKEATGNLDDVVLRDLDSRLTYLRKLEKRKEDITQAIDEGGKLTPALQKAIAGAVTLQEVEDLYLPYKKKKRTRATIAREKGLLPLAEGILSKTQDAETLQALARTLVDPEKGVADADEAFAGASDIVAEIIADDAGYRKAIRDMVMKRGKIRTAVTKEFREEKTEFDDYYDYSEPLSAIVNHRILAINRGEKKKVLSVKIEDGGEAACQWLIKQVAGHHTAPYLRSAAEDAYNRLIFPAVEREVRSELKARAEESAIRNFAMNLKKLLLQPPFKNKVTMGFDPAYRTGCKIAVLDALGTLKATATVYPTKPHNRVRESEKVVLELIDRFNVDIIAIGNGTASRESERFIADTIKKSSRKVQYVIVSEAGASVYSASELGTEEYPDINVSLRGAISIGGRLQDPLAELVKIDPKHIGVGQYQHDVNQKELEKALDDTVEDAVNSVGVDVNRASVSLLKHVSGINTTIARNIVAYRESQGPFADRRSIKKVKGLGDKAFEQCAGFLRIPDGADILDNTAVHPESYKAADRVLKALDLTAEDLTGKNRKQTGEKLDALDVPACAEAWGVGVPTLRDIIRELKKPGRDPRDAAPRAFLKSDVMTMDDLAPDMELVGTVRNVVDFGVFVDIGVHQDGLVHISQICDRYLKHPSEVLSIGDVVTVKVMDIDKKRNRIALTMLI